MAIKIVDKNNLTDSSMNDLISEIEVMKKVDHPNVVKLLNVFEDKKNICLVYEFMEAGDLLDFLNNDDEMSEFKVQQMM